MNVKGPFKGFSEETLKKKGIIEGVDDDQNGDRTFHFQGGGSEKISPRECYIIGIDVVGYSRRSLDGQLLLTTWLFSIIRSAIDNLRAIHWIPGSQPTVLIPTGDGALIVFDSGNLGGAAALVYSIQMWIDDINNRRLGWGVTRSFDKDQDYPVLPIHCRYVLAKGEIVQISGLNNELNAVGPGLVTCSRILAASKGAHFLVHSTVMDDFYDEGGIEGAQIQGNPWNWSQSLHFALMPEKSVKTARLNFYNVFGKFKPVALMMERGASREDAFNVASYDLGSHDVSTIIG